MMENQTPKMKHSYSSEAKKKVKVGRHKFFLLLKLRKVNTFFTTTASTTADDSIATSSNSQRQTLPHADTGSAARARDLPTAVSDGDAASPEQTGGLRHGDQQVSLKTDKIVT